MVPPNIYIASTGTTLTRRVVDARSTVPPVLLANTTATVLAATTLASRTKSATSIPIEAKYYGYVEPNPELFARAKYAVDYLEAGLQEQGVMTEEANH